jgi:SAM-dependent methyltransferase
MSKHPMNARQTESQEACPLCSAEESMLLARRDRTGRRLTVVLCTDCGLGRVTPLPSSEQLLRFYEKHYRQDYKSRREPAAHHVLRGARIAVSRLRRLRGAILPGARVLDAGCGSGEFLYLLRSIGCDVVGIDPDEGYRHYVERELGLTVYAGGLHQQNFPAGAFDLITLFHVLEHLPQPVESLRQLSSWLRPEGLLVVEVPNLESRAEHPARRFHPAHVTYFSGPALTYAGERAGLTAESLETSPDGGNLLAVFRKRPPPHPTLDRVGVARLVKAEQRRLRLRYYLAPGTWNRARRRLSQQLEERLTARRFSSRRAILDSFGAAL